MGCSASKPNNFLTKNHHHRRHHHHHHHFHHNSLENNPSSSCHSLESNTLSSSSPSPKPVSSALSLPLPLPTPLVHHPPSRKGDSHHLVSLTSTTYGYGSLLLMDTPKLSPLKGQDYSHHHHEAQYQMATTTSPIKSLSPDSVINTWELMDGLDFLDCHDLGTIEEVSSKIQKNADNSCGSVNNTFIQADSPSLRKPLWKHLSEELLLSNMDPNVASSYRRALSSRQLGYNNNQLRKPSSISLGSSPVTNDPYSHPSVTKDQIILIYFTSLRGIRKTHEDCCIVRTIFKSYRVAVDERDISMDSNYRKELQRLLLEAGTEGKGFSLPQVFIRGQLIGGAEEIKQLNESGELAKLLQGFPLLKTNLTSFCKSCGDARFLPCSNCFGSRKVFDEEENQLRRCSHCNENGLIRCPSCCCNLV